MSKYILKVRKNIKFIVFLIIHSVLFKHTLLLSVYDLNLSPLLDTIKRSPAISHAIVRSKQKLLRALLSPLLVSIRSDMFVTSTLVMGTDQFPETWVFEQFKTTEFSGVDSRIRM
jgi:hypothetical protein